MAAPGDYGAVSGRIEPATSTEEALKQKLVRMQLASAGAAREFRMGPPPPRQTQAALDAAEARRRKHEDPFDTDIRLRKAKLDSEAMVRGLVYMGRKKRKCGE